jgi:threonine/homoserine/homoserine lactone efflux protein
MVFRRKSRKDRIVEAAERMLGARRTAATAVGVATGALALLAAASSGVSSLRQKSS